MALQPALRSIAADSCWAGQLGDFRHLEAHFILDDFEQRDVGDSETAGVGQQRPALGAASGIELADPPGNHVHEDAGVLDFCQCLFDEISIHLVLSFICYTASFLRVSLANTLFGSCAYLEAMKFQQEDSRSGRILGKSGNGCRLFRPSEDNGCE